MKINNKWLMLALVLTLSAVFLVPSVQAIDGGYVGTDACLACHDGGTASDKTSFLKTGHPYKYQNAGGVQPSNWIGTLLTPLLSGLNDVAEPSGIYVPLMVDNGSGRLDWSAIQYTTGGFGWKLRWGTRDTRIGNDCANPAGSNCRTGYVWDADDDSSVGNQYRMKTNDWNDMDYNAPLGKKYSCAICHNTNGTSSYDALCTTPLGSGRTEPWAKTGLTPTNHGGFYSEWTFDGVQCEACHGPGEGHGEAGTISALTITGPNATQVEICAKCHVRSTTTTLGFGGECGGDADTAILTNGACMGPNCASDKGFIGHHEQYNELVGLDGDGVHASLTCTTCHDPHKRATSVASTVATALGIGDPNGAAAGAITKQCSDCHGAQAEEVAAATGATQVAHRTAGVTCVDCHMAEATSTANSWSSGWGKRGDLKSHLFKIDPSATASIKRQNSYNKYIANNALTVEFACGKCHAVAGGLGSGVGIDGTVSKSATTVLASKDAAAAAAAGYHSVTGIDGGYVGSNACAGCHETNYNDFAKSGHPYKYQYAGGQPLDNYIGTVFQTPLLIGLSNSPLYESLKVDADVDGRLDWSAIEYTTGGFGWKLRWGVRDTVNNCGYGVDPLDNTCATGYVWDADDDADVGNQYRLKTDDWNDMDYNQPNGKKYSCAICHNTNGTSSYDSGCTTPLGTAVAGDQDGNEGREQPWASTGLTSTNHGGFYSEWSLDGVQCEACHGPAANHVKSPSAANITKNLTTGGQEICAKCHVRSTTTSLGFGGECGVEDAFPATEAIMTNGACMGPNCASDKSFIGHHEQFNELVGYSADGTLANADGVHKDLSCMSCHNPHKRTTTVASAVAIGLSINDNDQSAETRGAVVSCESCHGSKTLAFDMGATTCVDCHMGEATSTANSWNGTWGKKGDLKSHLFKIDPAATSIKRQNAAGKYIAANALTVDFACAKCHDSGLGTATALTQATAAAGAVNMHGTGPTAGCTDCHTSTPGHVGGHDATPYTCVQCHEGAHGTIPTASTTDVSCSSCHTPPAPPVANFTATCDATASGKVNLNAASSSPATCPADATSCTFAWTGTNCTNANGATTQCDGATGATLDYTIVGGTRAGTSSKTLTLPACVITPDAVCGDGHAGAVAGSRTVSFTIDGTTDTVTRINWGDTNTTADPTNPVNGLTHLYAYDSTYAIRWTVENAVGKEAQCGPVYHKVSAQGTKHKVTVNLADNGTLDNYTAVKVWLYEGGLWKVKANGGTALLNTWTSGNLNSVPGYVVQLLKYGRTFTCGGTAAVASTPAGGPTGWVVDLSSADATLSCTTP